VRPTGVTLSQEQANFIKNKSAEMGIEEKVRVNVMNVWDLPENRK